jgi:PIN domain
MATEYIGLPGELVEKVKEAAAREEITPEELVRDAVENRLSQAEWRKTVEFGHRNARERGLKPEDVDAEISAARAELSRWVLRVTANTNVIVSALNFPGNPWRILDLAARGEIRLAVSSEILNEVNRVLLRQKFGWSQDRVDAAIRQIAAQKLTFRIGHDFRGRRKTHVLYQGTTSVVP